jgi:hypothetical protein
MLHRSCSTGRSPSTGNLGVALYAAGCIDARAEYPFG